MVYLRVVILVVLLVIGGSLQENRKYQPPETIAELAARPFLHKDCSKHVHTGFACMAFIRRYKWNQKEQQCTLAIYGGCHPTKNNFQTFEDCQKVAEPICANRL
uniref:Inducible serine protease inhibitor 2-like isoform X2 n=1 Tax=Diabrotica virgifera virgifera TaxID=50390 RepID=A0A6P7F048_DIAVI